MRFHNPCSRPRTALETRKHESTGPFNVTVKVGRISIFLRLHDALALTPPFPSCLARRSLPPIGVRPCKMGGPACEGCDDTHDRTLDDQSGGIRLPAPVPWTHVALPFSPFCHVAKCKIERWEGYPSPVSTEPPNSSCMMGASSARVPRVNLVPQ